MSDRFLFNKQFLLFTTCLAALFLALQPQAFAADQATLGAAFECLMDLHKIASDKISGATDDLAEPSPSFRWWIRPANVPGPESVVSPLVCGYAGETSYAFSDNCIAPRWLILSSSGLSELKVDDTQGITQEARDSGQIWYAQSVGSGKEKKEFRQCLDIDSWRFAKPVAAQSCSPLAPKAVLEPVKEPTELDLAADYVDAQELVDENLVETGGPLEMGRSISAGGTEGGHDDAMIAPLTVPPVFLGRPIARDEDSKSYFQRILRFEAKLNECGRGEKSEQIDDIPLKHLFVNAARRLEIQLQSPRGLVTMPYKPD